MSNGRPWTSDEDARLRRLIASGMTHGQIGEDMKRNRMVIQRKCVELNLTGGYNPRIGAMMARINMRRRMARAT